MQTPKWLLHKRNGQLVEEIKKSHPSPMGPLPVPGPAAAEHAAAGKLRHWIIVMVGVSFGILNFQKKLSSYDSSYGCSRSAYDIISLIYCFP